MERLKSIFAVAILFAIVFCSFAFGAGPIADTESENQTDAINEKSLPDYNQGYPCEKNLIEVMFEWDSKVRFRDGTLTDLATDALAGVDEVLGFVKSHSWHRFCSVPESKLDELRSRGEANKKAPLYDLNNIYRLKIPDNLDIWEISRQLEALPGILLARPVPLPTALPVPGNFQPQQNYEDPAASTPTGIDAEYAWTQTGGAGTGVTICDLEYGWNLSHQDLPAGISQVNPNTLYLPSGETDDHGTAVLGVMGSLNNGWGTTGICYNASFITCGTYYDDPGVGVSWNVPGALAYAMSYLSAGDVIIIENQWDYLNAGTAHPDFIPIEWWLNYWPSGQSFNGVYAAIQNAVALGIHVIEAGGNGGYPTLVGIDTDALIWYPGNSGAIIVGAGGAYSGGTYPEGDLEKVNFSSYGSRFDLQGWGEDVVTTGYGYYYNSEGKNLWYTNSFAGTSSASPIVAGAVACCVGYWTGLGYSASLLTPSSLRDVLKNTGTPQILPPWGVIGPRPNLLAAFGQLKLEWVDDSKAPINVSGASGGHAWGDYDDDGDLDLFVGGMNIANSLFQNDGSGNFTDVSSSPINNSGRANGSAWADFDNDGNLDLYLAKSTEANQLFQGTGSAAFTDVSAAPVNDAANNSGTAWADFDNDGLADIYLVDYAGSNKIFKNDGGGSFSDVTAGPEGDASAGIGAAWGDYDNDGNLDIYICNYSLQPNKLIRNNGDGSFSDVTSGPLGDAGNGMCAAWGDYDNDEDLDIYLAGDNNKLFRNNGGGSFTDVTSGPLSDPSFTYGANWGDYDNDGDLDIYLANMGSGNKLLRNDGGGTFVDATTGPVGSSSNAMGASFADYDGDGDLDLYVSNSGGSLNELFKNVIGTNNHWFHIDLEGTISNKSAIGARVKIITASGNQIREVNSGNGVYGQNSLTVEFGLGSNTVVDQIEIKWPSGTVQTLYTYGADQKVKIIEPSGSCDCTPGECDGAAPIDILDIVHLIDYKFKECPPGAGLGTCPPPTPYAICSGDADCNCIVDILDIVLMIDYKFKECPPGAGFGTCPPPCSCEAWVAQCGTPIQE
jgi:hypothetical protein